MASKRESGKDALDAQVGNEMKGRDFYKVPEFPIHEEDLCGFTIRLPKSQRETLERWLWSKKGEKLAPGVRRIITEYMVREGIR